LALRGVFMELENVKGTIDELPERALLRERIADTLKGVFKKYGFVPLNTSCLQKFETLTAKGSGGEEIKKETYNFDDNSRRRIGLRFDLTVPTARLLSENKSVTMPLKRYEYGKVWRYQEIKPGRQREFYQFDIDIFGTKSLLAEAELISCAVEGFKALGFKEFKIRLNNRKLLKEMIKYSGVNEEKITDVFRSIDKLDKIGVEGVKKELEQRGIKKETPKIIEVIQISGRYDEVLNKIKKILGKNEGIDELEELAGYLNVLGIENQCIIDLSLVRGLEYYTGTIFEISAEGLNVSFAGGGRYDSMIQQFGGNEIPAVGLSFGIEPIIQVMEKKEEETATAQVFVAVADSTLKNEALKIADSFRKQKISTELNLSEKNLSKQFEYCNRKKIMFAVIVGSRDFREKKATVKNMLSGEETMVALDKLSEYVVSVVEEKKPKRK